MKFLFVHQNFPAQFLHLAAHLAKEGHEVLALGIQGRALHGVKYVEYSVQRSGSPTGIPLGREFESKLERGLACAHRMAELKRSGFEPDVIVAHPGWGEALFCKDVWPHVRLLICAEFYYTVNGADFNFDPEFFKDSLEERARVRLKNSVHLQALSSADAGYAPTVWQWSRFPEEYRHKLKVLFEGIDTKKAVPNRLATIRLMRDGISLKAGDEVVTYVARNLEPYRGFHTFMRALPEVLRRRPNAHCIVVGDSGVSYGAPPMHGGNWRAVMEQEVGGKLPRHRIHYLGRINYLDYLRVLQISACHVYLTYPFVLSWSCLEAMSAGCLVVGSRTAPVQEVIEDGNNGLLTDFFDPQALASALISVLEEPGAFESIRARARQSVIDKYDIAKCLPRQIEFVTN